jgi:hypothetical protein
LYQTGSGLSSIHPRRSITLYAPHISRRSAWSRSQRTAPACRPSSPSPSSPGHRSTSSSSRKWSGTSYHLPPRKSSARYIRRFVSVTSHSWKQQDRQGRRQQPVPRSRKKFLFCLSSPHGTGCPGSSHGPSKDDDTHSEMCAVLSFGSQPLQNSSTTGGSAQLSEWRRQQKTPSKRCRNASHDYSSLAVGWVLLGRSAACFCLTVSLHVSRIAGSPAPSACSSSAPQSPAIPATHQSSSSSSKRHPVEHSALASVRIGAKNRARASTRAHKRA